MDIISYLLGKQSSGGGGGGDTPTKGIIFSEWDEDGYPTSASIVGLATIPDYYLQNNSNGTFLKNVSAITVPNNITSIGWYGFQYMPITQISLPNTLTVINQGAFGYCSKLMSVTLPNSVTTLGSDCFRSCTELQSVVWSKNAGNIPTYCFALCSKLETINLDTVNTISSYAFQGCSKLIVTKTSATSIGDNSFNNCYAIKKICLPDLVSIAGNQSNNGSFRSCSYLKQVWVGANVANNGLGRYGFNLCSALEKIYINLPRATVEGMTGYSYAFMNDQSKTGIIVCNDDAGFITEEEFDALPVE